MGKKSVEIQHDIDRQRQMMSARISRLRRQVRDDMDNTKDRVRTRASNLRQSAQRAPAEAGSTLTTNAGADSTIAEHPKGLLAGSFAGGAILGWTSSKAVEQAGPAKRAVSRAWERGEARLQRQFAGDSTDRHQDGGGGMLTSLVDTVRGYVLAQGSEIVQSAIDGLTSGKDRDNRSDAEELRAAGERPPMPMFSGHQGREPMIATGDSTTRDGR